MKVYVEVELWTDTAGIMHPTAVRWEDGRRFEILRVSDYAVKIVM